MLFEICFICQVDFAYNHDASIIFIRASEEWREYACFVCDLKKKIYSIF